MKPKTLTYEQKREIVKRHFNGLMNCSARLQTTKAIRIVTKAFNFADKAHIKQFRKGGQKLPFIIHPIAVARIVAEEMGFGKRAVTAALLHDTVEDTEVTLMDIQTNFGAEIARIVDGLTKITHLSNNNNLTLQSETFRSMILKTLDQKLIGFIKIADRLHNLRTISDMAENSKMVKTAETLMVYAPIAHQFGLFLIKKELENLSFRNRHPKDYKEIKRLVDEQSSSQKNYFDKIESILQHKLTNFSSPFSVELITRSYYSIWEKMKGKKMDLSKIHNFAAIRIVFEPNTSFTEKQQCFMFYALLTDHFNVNTSIKDWITYPKRNGFETLLINVMLEGRWIEVQIMTTRMNEIALRGYAPNHDNSRHLEETNRWLSSVGAALQGEEVTIEKVGQALTPYQQEIQIFTNKGDMIVMKKGATVLDYAFEIHSDIGYRFRAADMGGEIVPYNTVLEDSKVIYIITNEVEAPKPIWQESVTTSKAKNYLRKYFKNLENEKIAIGKPIFNNIVKDFAIDEKLYTNLCKKFHCEKVEDIYIRIAENSLTEQDIKRNLPNKGIIGTVINTFDFLDFFNSTKTPKKNDQIIPANFSVELNPFNHKVPFEIFSMYNIKMASCCEPIPSDEALIIKNKKKNTLTVHKRECKTAKDKNALQKDITASVIWKLNEELVFPATLFFQGMDRPEIVSDLVKLISQQLNLNMIELNVKAQDDLFEGKIKVLVNNKKTINAIVKKIKTIKDIKSVYRK